MAQVRVFWCEPTAKVRVSLRRFSYPNEKRCSQSPADWGCDASIVIVPSAPEDLWIRRSKGNTYEVRSGQVEKDDRRWPIYCDECECEFDDTDRYQVQADIIYTGVSDGKVLHFTLREPPVGAMWDSWWMPNTHRGPDGIVLTVMTPGGMWMVDSRASNCTLPGDDIHKCWVRHGDPRTGDVHVDKNGVTCQAGAGSIATAGYHGFLNHGYLTSCP